MSDAQYVFVLGPDTPPEVVLFAASIGRSLARGNDVRFVDEEPEELIVRDPSLAKLRMRASEIAADRARLIMCGDADLVQGRAIGNIWRLSTVWEPAPTVRLETEGKRFGFPLVMSSSILRRFGRTLAGIPRIVVSVSGDGSRRERMLARVVGELAARRWPHTLVVIAPSAKFAKNLNAVEAYVQPDACEIAAIISSATLVLETVEGDDAPSPLSCLASSVGVPVVTHSTSLLVRQSRGEVRAAAEWSPDAFAGTVIELAPDAPADLAWGVEFDEVAEDFGRTIQLA